MAPKRQVEKVEAKQVLTAVLLADSFTQRFRPITVEKPKVLLPLVNAPLLEYTLEWLALNQIEEIIIFCCAHADQIQEHLADSKWLKQKAPRVLTVTSTNCFSLGEAMRSLDQRDIVKGTFILVTGDTVSNMDLRPILAAHRERAERDKDAIMTLVMKSVQTPYQRLRLGDTNLLVALDKNTQRLLKYQELEGPGSSTDSSSSGAAAGGDGGDGGHHQHHRHHHQHHGRRRGGGLWKMDAALWSERDVVQVRTDLMDTNISICSPEVLMMFSDNFDYQTLKRDFVVGTLSEEELGKKIYLHMLQGEYAARVHNMRSYDAISRDLLSRWAYPFVPDTNVFYKSGEWGPSSYRYGRGHKYLEAVTTCSRKAQLGSSIAIGAGTSIGDDCSISRCVIGRGCVIGKGCNLHGCYLQDKVVLGDNVTAHHALLCGGVVVHSGATLQPGVVLSYNVVVAAKHTVLQLSVVTLCKQLQGQVSLSDDELEYSSAGRTSGSGGGGKGAPRTSMDGKAAQRRRSSRSGPAASSSSSSSSDEDSDEDETSSSSSSFDAMGGSSSSLEKPPAAVLKVAAVLAGHDKAAISQVAAEAQGLGFATHLVGEGGAGYEWPQTDCGYDVAYFSIAPPPMRIVAHHGYDSDAEGDDGAAAGGSGDEGTSGAAAGGSAGRPESGTSRGPAVPVDPETVFMQEVAETFLRCVKERFAEDNVVIELNALKIAEDRSFADCARYILTTLLALCLPAPAWVSPEYVSLFASDVPDSNAKEGKLQLLARFKKQMTKWQALLRRFLTSEDDQVELLLTMEEFCGEEGVFELPAQLAAKQQGSGSSGTAFAPLFANLLQLLYDADLVEEAAIYAWAEEKQHADEDEKVFLNKCSAFLEWLKTADEDSSGKEESDD